jgi:hypothetical protein
MSVRRSDYLRIGTEADWRRDIPHIICQNSRYKNTMPQFRRHFRSPHEYAWDHFVVSLRAVLVSIGICQAVAYGAPVIAGVTNAASGVSGPVAPGEIVTIYGNGMGPAQLTQAVVTNRWRLFFTLQLRK